MKTLLLIATLGTSLAAVPLVSGKLVLKKDLSPRAKGIRTVFFSFYDPAAAAPMPCGAAKLAIEKDASGEFLTYTLDEQSVMLMGCPEIPATFNLKVKLDKDGSAGRDSAGDLVGMANGVKKGSVGVVVNVDKFIA